MLNNIRGKFSQVVDSITEIGKAWHSDDLVNNAIKNAASCKATIKDIPPLSDKKRSSAIIISAGPSLHKFNVLERIRQSGYQGTIVCVDGSYVKCLRNGITPDFVLTLDPHPTRIVRWFGDPDFEKNAEGDDYFSRQDLDVEFRKNTIRQNNENIQLVNQHAFKTPLIICSSAPANVVTRTLSAGFTQYWWNPIVDDPKTPSSLTRKIFNTNKIPCMNTGGTVGTAAWVFAHSVLNIKNIAVVGMDLGYHLDTPIEMTQTYYELQQHVNSREELESMFPRFTFPLNNSVYYTDPTYFWYRKNFLDLLGRANGKTFNCSEAGTLHGPGIECIELDSFLTRN